MATVLSQHKITKVAANQRRHELMALAHWIEQHFALGAQPKIHTASPPEIIYAQVLSRIAFLTEVISG